MKRCVCCVDRARRWADEQAVEEGDRESHRLGFDLEC